MGFYLEGVDFPRTGGGRSMEGKKNQLASQEGCNFPERSG